MNTDTTNNQQSMQSLVANGVETIPVGIFEVVSANDVLLKASLEKEPEELWGEGMVYENEVTVIFSDTNTGKSILAVQIGEQVARTGRNVLYVDFELSDFQFLKRYRNDEGETYKFPDNFYRASIRQYAKTNDEAMIAEIIKACGAVGAEVVIIDNLSWLEARAEKREFASLLMEELVALKHNHGLTILVVGHTVKRYLDKPITENDLSGSKVIANFIDSAIAIGRSIQDPKSRYIKQIKIRSGEKKYDSDNVLLCELDKGENGNFLHFKRLRTSTEDEQLKPLSVEEREQQKEEARELSAKGMSLRAIAEQIGVCKSTIGNWIKGDL